MVNLDPVFVLDCVDGLPSAVKRFEQSGPDRRSMCVCAPSVAEVRKRCELRPPSYRRRAEALVSTLEWLELDSESCRWAARIAADLSARGERLPGTDLFVAAIALRHGHGVLSRSPEYRRVRGLRVEPY